MYNEIDLSLIEKGLNRLLPVNVCQGELKFPPIIKKSFLPFSDFVCFNNFCKYIGILNDKVFLRLKFNFAS